MSGMYVNTSLETIQFDDGSPVVWRRAAPIKRTTQKGVVVSKGPWIAYYKVTPNTYRWLAAKVKLAKLKVAAGKLARELLIKAEKALEPIEFYVRSNYGDINDCSVDGALPNGDNEKEDALTAEAHAEWNSRNPGKSLPTVYWVVALNDDQYWIADHWCRSISYAKRLS